MDTETAREVIEESFQAERVDIHDLETRPYPDETIFVLYVKPSDFRRAVQVGNQLDTVFASQGFAGFVSIRERGSDKQPSAPATDLTDDRVSELMNLLVARSRASQMHPSLSYVPDVAGYTSVIPSQRHHLVFGRRGAGKTALLVEGKRLVEQAGYPAMWLNLLVYRWEPPARIFAQVVKETVSAIDQALVLEDTSGLAIDLQNLDAGASHVLASGSPQLDEARALLPSTNSVLRRFCRETALRLYVFLDDFHYVKRSEQPQILDLIHGMTRDADVWLKVAAIRNLTRWYSPSERLGLETVHDADTIDLDITLSDPARAKSFLEAVLNRFANHVGLRSASGVFHTRALDRLVLASGGVPRDYLTLAAASIRKARSQERKRVGMQDVNSAAGDAAQAKIDELGEDLAASGDLVSRTQNALRDVRRFCLEDKRTTFFRVDVNAKDNHESSYEALVSLMDLRLLHLIEPSLSDAHEAGKRYEVFMLDLSQFSGQRLKRAIRTLDFKNGLMVRHETGKPDAVGETPRKLNTILRSAPLLDLGTLPAEVTPPGPAN